MGDFYRTLAYNYYAKKITISEIKEKLYKIHGDVIILDESTYVNISTMAKFIDCDYGEWWTYPYSILRGHQHIKRGKEKIKLTIEEVQKRMHAMHGDITILDGTTYVNITTKARFIDIDYGEWWTYPHHILQGQQHIKRGLEKRKQTNLKKYGFTSPSQNKEVARKTAKSQNNSYITHNWATNEEQVCQGSWEYKVVLYLNANKISYKWQPKVFKIPNISKTYRPDLYLIDTDTWIEIKGYFRKDALEKWNWFHSTYPNSDLWNKEKLKEMEIL